MERLGFTPDAPCLPLPLEELTNTAGPILSDGVNQSFTSSGDGVKSKVRKLRKAIDKLCKRNDLVEAIMLSNKLVHVAIEETADVLFQREAVYQHVKLISLLSNGKRKASEDVSMCVEFLDDAILLLNDPRLEPSSVVSGAVKPIASPKTGRRVVPQRFSKQWTTCRFNLQILLHTNNALCHYQLARGVEAKQQINKAASVIQRAERLHLKVGPEVESFARLAMCSLHSQEGMHNLALGEAERAISAIEPIVVPERGQPPKSSANLIESLVYAYYNAGVETEHLTTETAIHPAASVWYDKALRLARRHYRLFAREMIRSFENATKSCHATTNHLQQLERPSSAPARRRKVLSADTSRMKDSVQHVPKWLKHFARSVVLGLEPDADLTCLQWIEFLGELNKSREVAPSLTIHDLAHMLQRLFKSCADRVPALHHRLRELLENFTYDTSLQREILLKGLETFAHLFPTSFYEAEIHFKDIIDAAALQDHIIPQWNSGTAPTHIHVPSEELHQRLRSLSKLRFDSTSMNTRFTSNATRMSQQRSEVETSALLNELKQGPVPMARPILLEADEAHLPGMELGKFKLVEVWPPLMRHEEVMRIVKSSPCPSVDWEGIAHTFYELASMDDTGQMTRDVKAVLSSSYLDFSSQLQTLVLTMSEKLHG